MIRVTRFLAPILAISLVAGITRAQDPAAQMREAAQQFDVWMSVIGETIRDVQFDEADVRRLLEHWSEFEKLNLSGSEGIGPDRFRAEIDRVQRDPQYRAWAESIGGNPDTWLRKGLRIQTAVMQDQAAAMRAQWEAERAKQSAAVEAQCAALGAEACAEMRAMLEAGLAMAQKMLDARDKLPRPTAEEQALIEKYRLEILSAIGAQ